VQVQILNKYFDDALKSKMSMLILDDFERLIELRSPPVQPSRPHCCGELARRKETSSLPGLNRDRYGSRIFASCGSTFVHFF